MSRFVAFVDILGFKEMVKESKDSAAKTIRLFSKLVYDKWSELEYNNEKDINGFIVSDCAIIHTNDDSPEQLDKLFVLLNRIFPEALFRNGLLLRCAVTKGDFNELPSHGFENLSKRLIVGKAYVDATVLESKFKGANIIFGEDVHSIIPEIVNGNYTVHKISKDSENENFYSIQWANVEEFIQQDNLSAFIDLGNKAKWLPHYYETIHLFLKGVSNSKQKEYVWNNIFDCILKKEIEKSSNYNNMDTFIINAFSQDIDRRYKKMVAKYLRDTVKNSHEKED